MERCYPFHCLPGRFRDNYIGCIATPFRRSPMNILQINSSARADGSHSTRLAGTVVERLRAAAEGQATAGTGHGPRRAPPRPQAIAVTVHDLGQTPHPELNEATLQALFTPSESRTPAQAARVA